MVLELYWEYVARRFVLIEAPTVFNFQTFDPLERPSKPSVLRLGARMALLVLRFRLDSAFAERAHKSGEGSAS